MYALRLLVLVLLFPFAVLGFTITFFLLQIKQICCAQRQLVGIFSYSSPEDYGWITQGLNSMTFSSFVRATFSFVISASKREDFKEAVKKCNFGILYHTKNRGRVNLTNVTDSIYDEELRYLSGCKGKHNVIVVVDDLDVADYEQKHRILLVQPDIAEFAQDLILVRSEDKMQQRTRDNKLQQIGDLMCNGSTSHINYCDYMMSMMRWFKTTVLHGSQQRPGDGLDTPLLG